MSALTGGFDAVVQLDERALQRVFVAMHQAGPSEHAYTHAVGGRQAELLINVPTVHLDTTPGAAGAIRATAASRVLYHDRPIASPALPGVEAACDVTIRANVGIPGGDPAPVTASTPLLDDWGPTGPGDIVIHGLGPAEEPQVRSTLLGFINQQRGALRLGFLADAGVTSAAARVVDRAPAQPPVLAVGMNLTPALKGTSSALTASVVQEDWAFAVAAEHVIGEVTARLAAELGGLPPPYGPGSVLLRDDGATQEYLDALTIAFGSGAIVITGAVRREGGGLFGTVSATWTTTVTLDLDASQRIVATATEPAVQLNEWYAVVGDWVTGGQIEQAIAASIRAAVGGGFASGGASDLLGDVLKRLGSAGTTLQVPLWIRASTVEIRPDAIVVHGGVALTTPPRPPVAGLRAMPGPTPIELVFHAGESWAPGGEVAGFRWDFGDGSSQQSAGTGAAFTASHKYAPGFYQACVTVFDTAGRSTQRCLGVEPGVLVLELLSGWHMWSFCKKGPTLDCRVTSTGAPIRAASVTAEGVGWSVSGTTDVLGRVSLTLDPAQVEAAGIALPKTDSLQLGAVHMSVVKAGWQPREVDVWMIDCEKAMKMRLAAAAHRERVLDRLAGYAALRDLIKRMGRRKPPLTTGPLGPVAPGADPRVAGLDEIGRAVELLSSLEDLIGGSDVLTAAGVLGIGKKGEITQLADRRFEELWSGIERAGRTYDERFGIPGRPPD
jgi:hypothetical protein